ncbi:MAG: TonB-dependent receptor, partial [Blastocatellia bacterium]|nr:TonB-dependent receptor [Blastocatellia bacterium]
PGVARVPSAADIAAARAVNAAIGRPENPLSTQLLQQLFPTPNQNLTAATGNNYSFAAPNTNDSDNFLVRIDHNFSDRLTLNGRYVFGDGNQTFPLTSGNGSPLPQYQTVVPTRVQLFGANLTQVLSARLINESRVGYNRYVQTFNSLDANVPLPNGLVTNAQSGGLPTIAVTGFVSLGAPTNVPRGRVSSGYQFVDNLTFTSGAHTYKAGVEYRRAIVNSFNDTSARGALNFNSPATNPPGPTGPPLTRPVASAAINSLADFLAGVPASNSTILRGSTRRDTFSNNYGAFLQDDWKITQRLTLNYGVRYEYLGIFKEEFNRLSNFVPGAGLVQVGQGLSDLYQPDYNNFAPRVGFAYDITGTGKTILRGSYGLYYDTPSQDFFLLQGFQTGGPSSPATNPLPSLGVFNAGPVGYGPGVAIFGPAGAAPSAPFALFAVDLNLRTPYISNYNLNIQYELRPGMALQVGYVGSQGRKLFRLRDINQASPAPPPPAGTPSSVATAMLQARRPFNTQFPQFSNIDYLETSANSNYNALQATFKQRLARGLNFFLTYTCSKSIDDASNGIYGGTRGVSFPQDSFNLAAERAVSVFDQRHRFSGNFTYDLDFLPAVLGYLPKRVAEGWQLGGIYTVASGLPITPFLSADVSGTGELNDRPNLISDPSSGARRDAAGFFNTAAFAAPALGTFGSSGRNTIIGPRLNIFDLSLGKATKLNDRFSTQFRAEFFNIFNHSNLSLPVANFSAANFGTITQTPDVTLGNPRLADGGPRVIQFGLKLLF